MKLYPGASPSLLRKVRRCLKPFLHPFRRRDMRAALFERFYVEVPVPCEGKLSLSSASRTYWLMPGAFARRRKEDFEANHGLNRQ